MNVLIDDVGSFPLPANVSREDYERAYSEARSAILEGKDYRRDDFVKKNFCDVLIDSFRQKLRAGLDVPNYPQQIDGIRQIGDSIRKAMEKGTFVVEDKNALLPEVDLLAAEAKVLSEEFGKRISLRTSLFGPMEHYLKEIGTAAYPDVLDGFSETVRRYAKNSILDTKYIKTEVVSIDEPSFGFMNISASGELIVETINKAFDFKGAVRQIHLHSSSRLPDLLSVKNIDVVSFEYAASPKNIESVSKRMLYEADKQIRVGISRTDIDTILAELHDQGITKPAHSQLVEDENVIRKRFLAAKEKFGNCMTYTGPDCGLGSWPSQEAAALLLKRTANAVKSAL